MRWSSSVVLLLVAVSPNLAAADVPRTALDSVLVLVNRGRAEVVLHARATESFTGARSIPLNTLSSVRAGDGSRIVVIVGDANHILENGQSLTAAQLAATDAGQRRGGDGPSLLRHASELAALFLPRYERGPYSSDRVRGDPRDTAAIFLMYPYEEPVLSTRPGFAWSAPPGTSRIRLYGADDPTLWLYEKHFEGPHLSISYPDDWPALRAGEAYFWEVVAGPDAEHVGTSRFTVVPTGRADSVRAVDARTGARCGTEGNDAESCLLVRAGSLVESGYRHEAIFILNEWLSLRQRADRGRAILTALDNLTGARRK